MYCRYMQQHGRTQKYTKQNKPDTKDFKLIFGEKKQDNVCIMSWGGEKDKLGRDMLYLSQMTKMFCILSHLGVCSCQNSSNCKL